MEAHKRYIVWLLALIAIEMAVVVSTSLYLDPLIGDSTRLGGYPENDFGWNRPQQMFEKTPEQTRQVYDRYADVLVIGDSFSFAGLYGVTNYPWQTYLAANAGFSVTTVNHYTKTLPYTYEKALFAGIVNSDSFQKNPPRVLILEVIERQLDILPDVGGNCRAEHAVEKTEKFINGPLAVPPKEVSRSTNQPPLKEQVAYAYQYLGRLLQRDRDTSPPVYALELSNDKLFSNRRSGRLLVYQGDVRKRTWDEKQVESIRCRLLNMQELVQKNGKTLFVAMLVPDKLSAYSGYLRDRSYANFGVIERLAADSSLHVPRLDLAMKAAIDSGMVDVYLPDDTHWSSRGHEIAAKVMRDYLMRFSGG